MFLCHTGKALDKPSPQQKIVGYMSLKMRDKYGLEIYIWIPSCPGAATTMEEDELTCGESLSRLEQGEV